MASIGKRFKPEQIVNLLQEIGDRTECDYGKNRMGEPS